MDSLKPITTFASRLRVLGSDDMVVLSFIDIIPSKESDSSDNSFLGNEFSRIAITPTTAKKLKNALDSYLKNHQDLENNEEQQDE